MAAKTGTEELQGLIAGDARMGHVSPGPYLPLDQAPMLVGDFEKLAEGIKPVAGRSMTFTAEKLVRPEAYRSIVLEPFYKVHDARYMLYWRTVSESAYEQVAAELKKSEAARLALESRTVDYVAPGEQQPEVEHQLAFSESSSGATMGRRWRDAAGWFSYSLKAPSEKKLRLIVTYYGDERGRKFEIFAGKNRIAGVELHGGQRDRFVDVEYPIPDGSIEEDRLAVKFQAAKGSRTGSVFGIRLVKEDN